MLAVASPQIQSCPSLLGMSLVAVWTWSGRWPGSQGMVPRSLGTLCSTTPKRWSPPPLASLLASGVFSSTLSEMNSEVYSVHIEQVAELASLAQLLPPCSPTVRNPAPDSSLCRAAPRLRPLQLLLAACVRFSCCSQA